MSNRASPRSASCSAATWNDARPAATCAALRRAAISIIFADRSTPRTLPPASRSHTRETATPCPHPTSSSRSSGRTPRVSTAHTNRSAAGAIVPACTVRHLTRLASAEDLTVDDLRIIERDRSWTTPEHAPGHRLVFVRRGSFGLRMRGWEATVDPVSAFVGRRATSRASRTSRAARTPARSSRSGRGSRPTCCRAHPRRVRFGPRAGSTWPIARCTREPGREPTGSSWPSGWYGSPRSSSASRSVSAPVRARRLTGGWQRRRGRSWSTIRRSTASTGCAAARRLPVAPLPGVPGGDRGDAHAVPAPPAGAGRPRAAGRRRPGPRRHGRRSRVRRPRALHPGDAGRGR